MPLINPLKKLKRCLRISITWVNRNVASLKYLHLKPKVASTVGFEANLLVVKNSIYAPIAKVCVESFLFFHPNATVRIYVDSVTESAVQAHLKRLISRNQVFTERISSEEKSWQDSKLDLILNMSNPNKFFMDADLKWNAPMPPLLGVTFFVNEFDFTDKFPYSELHDLGAWQSSSRVSMKNTSFLYWGEYKTTSDDKAFVASTMEAIAQLCMNGRIPVNETESLVRISEQVALSVLVDVNKIPTNYLKSSDGFKDGSFVESSYFGATGTSF